MPELLTMQDLANGHLDVKALGDAANGDENTIVTTRTGNTYPSAERAINIMFQNGGLPATPFASKALMTASSLANDKYAMVTDDTVNNGLYVKTAGAWVKSDYDPLAQAKTYADTAKSSAISTAAGDATAKANAAKSEAIAAAAIDAENKAKTVFKENDEGQYFDASAFSIEAHYNIHGQYNTGSPFLQTSFVAVKKGDVITASTGMTDRYPWAVMFDTSQTRTGNLGVAAERVFKERTATVTQDGFVVIQHASTIEPSASPKFEINKGLERYAKAQPVMDLMSAVNSKADEVKNRYFTDFEQGGGNYGQTEDDNVAQARTTDIYKFKAGTVINLKTLNTSGNNYQIGFGAGSQADIDAGKSPFNTFLAQTDFQATVAADKPYYRFYIRDQLDATSTLNIAQALTKISIFVKESVLRDTAIDVGSPSTVASGLSSIPQNSSGFRAASLATGGVITIIDDDGKAPLYTGLYPFLKNLDVPFGIAVHGGEIGNETYITKQQLDTMYADKKYIEVLSHGFQHKNLTSQSSMVEAEAVVRQNKEWFNRNGYDVDAFVYPNGGDNAEVNAMVSRYHNSAYDYSGGARVETFDTIKNSSIKRTAFNGLGSTVAYHKEKIDEAVANNGWLIITTHVDSTSNYWGSYAELTEIINYAKSKNMKFVKPREGFQIFGNIAENDSGFKIQANGKIVGAS